jgi:antitoxin YokJ
MEVQMNDLIERVQKNKLCLTNEATFSRKTWRDLDLPEDMADFYSSIDGFRFDTDEYWFDFFSFSDFSSLKDKSFFEEECGGVVISNNWCIFASQQGAFIAIDLDKNRLGRCYYVDFGMDVHVLALSFTEMVNKILDNNGTYPEWYKLEYKPIVDLCDF